MSDTDQGRTVQGRPVESRPVIVENRRSSNAGVLLSILLICAAGYGGFFAGQQQGQISYRQQIQESESLLQGEIRRLQGELQGRDNRIAQLQIDVTAARQENQELQRSLEATEDRMKELRREMVQSGVVASVGENSAPTGGETPPTEAPAETEVAAAPTAIPTPRPPGEIEIIPSGELRMRGSERRALADMNSPTIVIERGQ